MNPKDKLIQALRIVANNRPDVIIAASGIKSRGLSGMGNATQTANAIVTTAANDQGVLDKLALNLDKILASVLTYKQSEKILDINLERAKQGLPPIDAGSVAPTVNIGVSNSVTNLLLIGLAVAGFLYLVKK